ncbi:hypothetical protein SCARR_00444 [Pontiella sulfatireligans]|uniref:Uncharacterized protein n=1 Tax=Pontiella sulfatireligans TaxID=2750658 RepID=A0A6C2UDV5_9BACT|nr:hypothetical protein SCARR_00444 [Pontiella sulfatireligans]
MVSYPQVDDMSIVRKKKVKFSSYALSAQEGNERSPQLKDKYRERLV